MRIFRFTLDFLSLLWYCVVLTGGATNGKHNQRTVARQHHTARGQQNKLEGDERAPRVHGETYAFRRNIAKWADVINLSTNRNNYRKQYRERQYPILRLVESQRGVRILSKRKRGMLLGARSVLIVPLQYKIQADISSRRRYREESVPRGLLCACGMRTPRFALRTRVRPL